MVAVAWPLTPCVLIPISRRPSLTSCFLPLLSRYLHRPCRSDSSITTLLSALLSVSHVPTTLVSCWGFTCWQHLRSHQDGYRLVIVCTHGDFIVLPHWETMPPMWWPVILFSHIILMLSPFPILIIPSGWQQSDMYQFLSHWFDSTRVQIPWSPKSGDRRSTQLAIPSGPPLPTAVVSHIVLPHLIMQHFPAFTHWSLPPVPSTCCLHTSGSHTHTTLCP